LVGEQLADVINQAVIDAVNAHIADQPTSAQAVNPEDLLALGGKVVCYLLAAIGPISYEYELMEGCTVKATLEQV